MSLYDTNKKANENLDSTTHQPGSLAGNLPLTPISESAGRFAILGFEGFDHLYKPAACSTESGRGQGKPVRERPARGRVRLRANGEIRITSCPGGGGTRRRLLDQKTQFQDGYTTYTIYDTITDLLDIPRRLQAKPGYGALGKAKIFRKQARQRIVDAGSVLDDTFGKRLLFLTWTLPGHGKRQFKALAEQISYAMSLVTQKIRDTVSGAEYIWCIEHQKRGALHGHLVVGSNDVDGLCSLWFDWEAYVSVMLRTVGRKAGIDLFYSERRGQSNFACAIRGQRAEWASKSAARYLSKYVSKHASKYQAGEFLPVVRWSRVSNGLLRKIRALEKTVGVQAPSAELLRSAVLEICEKFRRTGGDVLKYANARFPWLTNAVIHYDAAQFARDRFEELLSELRHPAIAGCSLSQVTPCAVPREAAAEPSAAIPQDVFAQALVLGWRVLRPQARSPG